MTDETVLDAIMRALADPTRRRLYGFLRTSAGLTTGQLAQRVPGMTRWGVMKHISVLREAGLLQTLPEGRRRRHYVERGALRPVQRWLEQHEDG
ncbi:MAG TPA: helix-turn-helix domain-containing protein [Candidatus Limnocylindria bacterium]|nr:helix-turn-helix domain-containing protein [Candidatus Limnocylindria bacterium]